MSDDDDPGNTMEQLPEDMEEVDLLEVEANADNTAVDGGRTEALTGNGKEDSGDDRSASNTEDGGE
jgi:hypothetical protein